MVRTCVAEGPWRPVVDALIGEMDMDLLGWVILTRMYKVMEKVFLVKHNFWIINSFDAVNLEYQTKENVKKNSKCASSQTHQFHAMLIPKRFKPNLCNIAIEKLLTCCPPFSNPPRTMC